MSPAASLVGEAALCDRVEPGEHRRWTPLAGQRCSCICEDFLSEVLGPMTVPSLSAEVAVDLRMVSPEGQFGEAFHYFPCRSATGKVTGFDDGSSIAQYAEVTHRQRSAACAAPGLRESRPDGDAGARD